MDRWSNLNRKEVSLIKTTTKKPPDEILEKLAKNINLLNNILYWCVASQQFYILLMNLLRTCIRISNI